MSCRCTVKRRMRPLLRNGLPATVSMQFRSQGIAKICDHGVFSRHCPQCKRTTDWCHHARRRYLCRECLGASVCPHGREQARCADCGGSRMCSHGIQQRMCLACYGAERCPHGRRQRICVLCNGNDVCLHGVEKRRCRACGGYRLLPSRLFQVMLSRLQRSHCMSPRTAALLVRRLRWCRQRLQAREIAQPLQRMQSIDVTLLGSSPQ